MESNERLIVIGDVHGCFHSLMRLMDKLPKGVPIVFVGDLVDRGDYVKDVLEFVLKCPDFSISSVMGNHEKMFIDYTERGWDGYNWIHHNGGSETILSYEEDGVCEVKNEHYDFIKNLPLTITIGKVLISHSHLCPYETLAEAKKNKNILWNRGAVKPIRGKYHVFGHTPRRNPIIEERYACIDTGCVFGGKLTAMELPSKKLYQVDQAKEDRNRWYGLRI